MPSVVSGYSSESLGPVAVAVDAQGRLKSSSSGLVDEAVYRLFIPPVPVLANQIFFDLFNASGSGKTLKVYSLVPVVSGTLPLVAIVAVPLLLQRTVDLGTGGTSAVLDGTSASVPSIAKFDSADPAVPALVTARLKPTAGAANGAVLSMTQISTDEALSTVGGSSNNDMISRGKSSFKPVVVREGSGLKVTQGTILGTGAIGFDLIFSLV